jgi:predicted NAD/FAD-binding protein
LEQTNIAFTGVRIWSVFCRTFIHLGFHGEGLRSDISQAGIKFPPGLPTEVIGAWSSWALKSTELIRSYQSSLWYEIMMIWTGEP